MKKLFFLSILLTAITIQAHDIYIQYGKVIDTKNGKVILNKTIIVSGKIIKSIKDGFINPINLGDKVIDLKTKTVMPGWIDTHVHLKSQTSPTEYLDEFSLNDADIACNAEGYGKATLMAGFTTVRDLGGTGVNVAFRNAINAGKVIIATNDDPTTTITTVNTIAFVMKDGVVYKE